MRALLFDTGEETSADLSGWGQVRLTASVASPAAPGAKAHAFYCPEEGDWTPLVGPLQLDAEGDGATGWKTIPVDVRKAGGTVLKLEGFHPGAEVRLEFKA